MKFLILFASALAVASAGHVHGYHGPIHLPVINGEGVPVDTADVQVNRAAHLAHVANVHHRNGDHALLAHGGYGLAVAHGVYGLGIAHPAAVAHAALAAHGAYAHAALAHHYRKRRGIYGIHGAAHLGGHGVYYGPQHLPIINGEGVPVDTADVQVNRAAHLAHVINVQHRNGDHSIYAHHGYHHY